MKTFQNQSNNMEIKVFFFFKKKRRWGGLVLMQNKRIKGNSEKEKEIPVHRREILNAVL